MDRPTKDQAVMIACDFTGCQHPATAAVRTGSDRRPPQTDHLCDEHVREHWEAVKGAVTANVMHYTILPLPATEAACPEHKGLADDTLRG